jgi:hypothetical protein
VPLKVVVVVFVVRVTRSRRVFCRLVSGFRLSMVPPVAVTVASST